ncbi:MAG: hypothetical protein IKZ88_09535 [Neisseriaceae bacterium]|nr:hypothetical protein [Neisseriaceae bacterium]
MLKYNKLTPIGVAVGWQAHPTAGLNFCFDIGFAGVFKNQNIKELR